MIHQRLTELGVGVRHYASNGNACDVSIPEIILHFGQDEQTRVIVVHVESLPDPRAFLEAATEVSRKMPILAMKAGRTAQGAKAVASHTGGMMTQDVTAEIMFEKAGVVSFRNIEELCQSAVGFASQPVPAGNRVGMIANTGGPAIIATDELIEGGMVMPGLSKPTEEFLKEKLYPEASINNPIDVLATAGPDHFTAALTALLTDDGVDAILLNFVTPFFVDTLGVAHAIAEANRRSTKPIVATVMTEKKGWAQTLEVIRDSGVPTYDMPETGARVLAAMGRYAALRGRSAERPASFEDLNISKARSIIETSKRAGRTNLSAEDAYALLTCYGIDVARCTLADDLQQCLTAAENIGYPVVLKVDAESILHKSDSGGVVLDIRDSDALTAHVRELASRFAETSPRFLVQQQLPPGREVIVGTKAVEGLGHVVMFGMGGIYVEVLKDASFKLTPVTQSEARGMIHSLRAAPLLTGVRGRAGVDLSALTETIQRVSQMLVDNPEIEELDINPIFAYPHGAVAADVRVML